MEDSQNSKRKPKMSKKACEKAYFKTFIYMFRFFQTLQQKKSYPLSMRLLQIEIKPVLIHLFVSLLHGYLDKRLTSFIFSDIIYMEETIN